MLDDHICRNHLQTNFIKSGKSTWNSFNDWHWIHRFRSHGRGYHLWCARDIAMDKKHTIKIVHAYWTAPSGGQHIIVWPMIVSVSNVRHILAYIYISNIWKSAYAMFVFTCHSCSKFKVNLTHSGISIIKLNAFNFFFYFCDIFHAERNKWHWNQKWYANSGLQVRLERSRIETRARSVDLDLN